MHQIKALRLLLMIMNKTKNPQNSGYQPKTMNNSKQHFVGNGQFSYTRSHFSYFVCNWDWKEKERKKNRKKEAEQLWISTVSGRPT